MLKSLDTETTGVEILHGCMPHYVSIAAEDGTLTTFGGPDKPWRVDLHTRKVTIPKDDIEELYWLLSDPDTEWVMQNAKFDTRVLWSIFPRNWFDPIAFLRRVQDTLLQSHALESGESHGLKDIALRYLDIADDDEKALQAMVNICRDFGRRQGWAIANPQSCPLYKQAPKAGWWVMDMWLPMATGLWLREQGLTHLNNKFTVDELINACHRYGGTDAIRTLAIYFPFKQSLEENNLWQVYEEQRLLMPVTFKMEQRGVTIHREELVTEIERIRVFEQKHMAVIREVTGKPDINLDSPKQMQQVIYGDFGREVSKVTDSGNPSCDKHVLEDILTETANSNPFTPFHKFAYNVTCAKKCDGALKFLEAYERQKLAYPVSPASLVQEFLYRLHPNFNITGTDTTRLSSNNPNGQNISKGKDPFIAGIYDPLIASILIIPEHERTQFQRDCLACYQECLDGFHALQLGIRKIFGPAAGREWWTVDYVQLQLVIFAYVSNEASMIRAVQNGMDFHDFMARKIFNIPDHKKPDEGQRRIAKNVNFGFIFGAGPAKIEATARMPGLYDILRTLFPNATKFIDANSKTARKKGCVYAAGYRLTVPHDKPYAATNYIIQGWEGRIVKRAMVYCDDYLDALGDDGYITLNVHDELVFDFLLGMGDQHIGHLCNLMEIAGSELGVPCRVDAKYVEKYWNKGVDVCFDMAV